MTVRILGTGGTISVCLEDGSLRLLPVADLCRALPSDLPEIETVDLVRVSSSALTPSDMLSIARQVCQAVRQGSDVVVTHGTDTLEETAFLTDLLLGDDSTRAGAVFTGAMRPASDPGTDGRGNLVDAIRVAASPQARDLGALVCFAREIHAARWVVKTDSLSTHAFASSPFGPIGYVTDEGVTVQLKPLRRWESGDDAETRVSLVRAYPGMSSTALDALVREGTRGIVIEGFGNFNVPEGLVDGITRALQDGVAVVVSSRARTVGGLDQGPIGLRTLHERGATGSYGLPATKAWVALMVALARCDGTPDQVRDWFRSLSQS